MELKVIRTVAGLTELQKYLEDKDFIAFDTETTGVDKDSQIIGFSVCAETEFDSEINPTAYYVVLREWAVHVIDFDRVNGTHYMGSKLIDVATLLDAKEFIQSLVGKNLVMHNGVFDCAMVKNNFGVDLIDSLHTDTMILAHVLDENRSCGLKELGTSIFGEDATDEQKAMKASVVANGGVLTKDKYELYKADSELIGKYGAKDALLTLKLFYYLVPQLYEQNLNKFFYEDESMPMLRGPTYQLNTTGLRIDPVKLLELKKTLEADCMSAKAFIHDEISAYVKDKFKGTTKSNTFNIGSSKQLAWLLFFRLGEEFHRLTDAGKELCRALDIRVPYDPSAKRRFIAEITERKGEVYAKGQYNPKTKKVSNDKKIADPWNYIACGKEALSKYADKYKWVEKFLEYAKNQKLLNTYVEGIEQRMKYNIINPSFLQHGTTSGRYSSKNPNFQNLPRSDKRVKSCVVARPGKVFVGADQAQLEPRVFASVSQDETLMKCFKVGEDFYSVIGAPIFDKTECSLFKDKPNSFARMHPKLRDKSKVIGLATPYGRTAAQQAAAMNISVEESQTLIDRYFGAYPKVELMMLTSHEQAKRHGVVYNLYGRPRRIPEAMDIPKIYGNVPHSELPYKARNILNLAMNHRVQSTASSIMNRVAIAVTRKLKAMEWKNPGFKEVKIVLQVHDELVLEGPFELADDMASILKDCMENTVELPGVKLLADPVIAHNLADLK